MGRTKYKIVAARKAYTCTEQTYHRIGQGDLYLYGACPPEHEANMGRKWWIIRACLRCAEKFGMHSSETRAQLRSKTGGDNGQAIAV